MQTFRFTKVKMLAALCLLFAALTGCKKAEPSISVPQEITVQFSNTGVPFSEIDSIVVVVRDQQQFIKQWKTLQKGSSSFKQSLQGLAAGNYTVELYAYSALAEDLNAKQYARTINIELPLKKPAVVNAPTGKFNDSWFKRAIFMGTQQNAIIIVAMDPRDSYYEVRLKQPAAKQIHLERYSVDNNVLVSSKSTIRDLTGLIGLGEYADYAPYVQAMNGKTWTKGVISGWIEQDGLGDVGFHYEYFYQ